MGRDFWRKSSNHSHVWDWEREEEEENESAHLKRETNSFPFSSHAHTQALPPSLPSSSASHSRFFDVRHKRGDNKFILREPRKRLDPPRVANRHAKCILFTKGREDGSASVGQSAVFQFPSTAEKEMRNCNCRRKRRGRGERAAALSSSSSSSRSDSTRPSFLSPSAVDLFVAEWMEG